MSHLKELSSRIIISWLAIAGGTWGVWPLADKILEFLLAPVKDLSPPEESLKYFAPRDAFAFNLQVALWAGLIWDF
ncbi:MAG: twin-arginine translocase subunit TatC [Deltaproteobacteria bacterium]|nr:twin-arginine translocase subunit TatC [Deltaproteobacteria bacterium]